MSWCNHEVDTTHTQRRDTRAPGATLAELVAVLVVAAVLLGVALPALHTARVLSKSEVCLEQLGTLMEITHEYTLTNAERLPSPLHPAVMHVDDALGYLPPGGLPPDGTMRWVRQSFVGVLGAQFGARMNNGVATCPAMQEVTPDAWFWDFSIATSRAVIPSHYALNNYGSGGSAVPPGSATRVTKPGWYFGYLPAPGTETQPKLPDRRGVRIGAIPNPDREWLMGEAIPPYPPHGFAPDAANDTVAPRAAA